MPFRFRHRLAIDLRGIGNPAYREIIQGALNACDFPLSRIRKRTGKRVPITVADLSRYAHALDARTGHGHVHNEAGDHGHLLGTPLSAAKAASSAPWRAAALGLYWLPTPGFPAGRVELDSGAMADTALAQEVALAELAHAVDYGALTDAQRIQVMALFDYTGGATPPPQGWFEEQGEQDYWRWRGERWMGLFMAVYAPRLARPLEGRQPWQWSYSAADVAEVRVLLR